jgi:integrase
MLERTPGTWRLRVFTGRDAAGRPVQVTRTFKGTKRQAQSALARFVSDVESGQAPLTRDTTTVAELLDSYIEDQVALLQPGTVRGYRDKSRRLKASLGPVRLTKLTAQQLDRTYRSWLTEGLSPATVHHCHALLSAAVHQAVRWGIVATAVTDKASPPPLRARTPSAASPATVRKLIEVAEESRSHVLGAAIALAAVTGCRRGELCGLRWSDLELETGRIWVRRAVKHGLDHRQLVVGPTKTHADRCLTLDPLAMAVLITHRERVEGIANQVGTTLPPYAYILSDEPDSAVPLKPDSLSQAFRRVAERVGVNIRFHDLRHFSATQLIGAGTDVRTVAGRLGHADPSTTLRVYSHALADRDKAAAQVLGELLFRPSAEPRTPGSLPTPP